MPPRERTAAGHFDRCVATEIPGFELDIRDLIAHHVRRCGTAVHEPHFKLKK